MSTPPLPRWLLPITIPASWLYRGAIAVRNRQYDRGRGVHRMAVPVISVGNITTGGVGKSPMVTLIAQLLRDAGHAPAIAMRGYGAAPGTVGDEQREYEAHLLNVPVIAHPNRVQAATAFLRKRTDINCLILDDGFQHRAMYRDLDLVLIDAAADTFAQCILPAGHLREPVHNLRRADAVIMTHASSVDPDLTQLVAQHHGLEPLAWSQHRWTAVQVITAHGPTQHPCDWLAGKAVVTMLGIGQPAHVYAQLNQLGAKLVRNLPARDHQHYDAALVRAAAAAVDGADALVVTHKDWVKLQEVLDWQVWPVPIVVPKLAIDIFEGRAALEQLLLSVMQANVNAGAHAGVKAEVRK
jgi:tetraacyldisaccharide 4'-kinase